MNAEQAKVVQECADLSVTGGASFGEIVARLIRAGIERYHADYSRKETTYYTPGGGSCVVAMEQEVGPVGGAFSAEEIEAAVRQSQRGEIKYPQFTRQAVAAGCVGYFVQISGKCVQYFGRDGEVHTEWFPGAERRW